MSIFKTQLHYLGHKISAEGLEPLPEKLDAIKKLAPAKNVDKACQIVGLLGYYHLFTPAFADITIPITNLLKRNVPFNWLQKCQATLDYFKEIICSKPILQFPDANKDYILYTDASKNAYSGVVCQLQENKNDIRPIAYFQEPSQPRTKVGVPLKKKHVQYSRVSRDLTTTQEVCSAH